MSTLTLRFRQMYLLVSALVIAPTYARAQQGDSSPLSRIDWQAGPTTGHLGEVAELKVPASCRFADAEGTIQFLELTHNPASGNEVGTLLCPGSSAVSRPWFVVFSYDATGLVKDDEKKSLDQAKILATIKEATDEGNEERRRKGWSELEILGWNRQPYYDQETHNLTWATRLHAKGNFKETINHSVRLLGRGGVMHADLVAGSAEVADAVATFDDILKDYAFLPGQRYSEWRAGDKVAAYGLTALIAGGAGAAAMKLGLFGKLWKLILMVLLAVKKAIIVAIAAIAGFFKKLFGKKKEPEAKPQPQPARAQNRPASPSRPPTPPMGQPAAS